MTARFGSGDRYLPAFPPERKSSDLSVGDEPTFWAREYFVEILQEEAPEAYNDFRQRVEPTFHEVFDVAWPPPGEQGFDRDAAFKAILKRANLPWEWPPKDTAWVPPFGTSPYAEAFGAWPPPPTPPGGIREVGLRHLFDWFDIWRFHGQLLTSLLGDHLDSWSEAWHLEKNTWVASHLLARSCKAQLLCHGDEAQHDVKLDHAVFWSPGFLARFKDSLAEAFVSSRDWDPIQEEWSKWRETVEGLFSKALTDYKDRVLAECEEHHLAQTPGKRESERDFRRLVRFQVLGQTQKAIRENNEDVRTVRRALKRTAELVGLRLRKKIL